MNKIETFQQFLTTQSAQVPLWGLVLNLFLVAGLSFILSRVYVRYGTALSNRRMFARNFVLIAMTTMLIIMIVKSSLALSLGLVGALSIVRFRAAIKEPEELSYLFLNIAIGLGYGADQRLVTGVAFIVICGVIMLSKHHSKSEKNQNLYLTVASHNPHKITLSQVVEILDEHCSTVNMKRFDENKEALEASFLIDVSDFECLQIAKSKLQQLSESVEITFLDNRGIISG